MTGILYFPTMSKSAYRSEAYRLMRAEMTDGDSRPLERFIRKQMKKYFEDVQERARSFTVQTRLDGKVKVPGDFEKIDAIFGEYPCMTQLKDLQKVWIKKGQFVFWDRKVQLPAELLKSHLEFAPESAQKIMRG